MPISGISYGFMAGFGFSDPVKEVKQPKEQKPKEYPEARIEGNYRYYHPEDKTLGGFFPKNALFLSSSPKK